MKINKTELLAPAGNIDSFYAVLRAGADAVYLAGNKFGARAYADNFSTDELCACIRYAHLYDKRVYLTVNTLLTDAELNELYDFLAPLYEVGLDGVIVQDLGVISYIYNNFPGMEVHASTQLNTTGIEGVNFLKKMGVCRVVPARELSLNEIKRIKSECDIEIECFIHGAICYCYSGQCLFSSVIGSRSGNRGRCAQPCRLPYSQGNKSEIYPLSLKDMCTIEYLPNLIEAGIDSFKIEGRMKKPEYAAGVTALYRKYIDQYLKNGEISVSSHDKKILSSLYIRSQVSEGYYEKYNGQDMITIDNPSYNSTDENIINEIHRLYVGNDAKLKLPEIKIEMNCYFSEGEPAYISISYNDIYIIKYGDVVDTAQKKAITADDILKQVNKLGATSFTIDPDVTKNNIFVSDNAYYNLKGINELRRSAIAELEEKIIESYGLVYSRQAVTAQEQQAKAYQKQTYQEQASKKQSNKEQENNSRYFNILINDLTQLNSVIKFIEENNSAFINTKNRISRIYIPEELFIESSPNNINTSLINKLNTMKATYDIDIYISMPYVRRMKDEKLLSISPHKLISGVLVRNIEDINYVQSIKNISPEIDIAIDYGVYTWNRKALYLASSYSSSVGMPVELCGSAQKELAQYNHDLIYEKMVYGRIPLMHTANCVNKTLGKCIKSNTNSNEQRWTSITDRTKRNLPIFTDCVHCQNTIYNAVPVTLTKEINNYPDNFDFRIDFTNETSNSINEVLRYYLIGDKEVNWEYTKAFEKHSTE